MEIKNLYFKNQIVWLFCIMWFWFEIFIHEFWEDEKLDMIETIYIRWRPQKNRRAKI